MRSALAMAAALDPLGPPPEASNDYVKVVRAAPPSMYGNSFCGDCVEVDTAYALILRTANTNKVVVPTQADVINLYKVFGYDPPHRDPGTDELSMCQYLKNMGFLGHRLNDYGTIDTRNIDHLKWAIQLFGGVRVGWALPNYAERQFQYNEPWDVTWGDQSSAGGHDTRLVRYEGDMFYTATWGRWEQPVTRAFVNTFGDEAHAELAYDWIQDQGVAPSGFSLIALEQKLQQAAA
jgi:hypothetical protein